MTEAKQSMNPPEEPQQKSSCDHHTLPQTPPPEQGKPPRHSLSGTRTDQTSCVDWSFSGGLLAVTPHTSPQFSAPFPNDVVVVVDDKNSVEQVRQSDGLEEGGVAERDSFKHILKFFFTYLHRVYKRCWCMYTFHLGDQPADPRRCPAAKLTGRQMKVFQISLRSGPPRPIST